MHSLKTTLIVVAIAVLASTLCCAAEAGAGAGVRTRSGTIAYVVDGDTLRVRLDDGQLIYVRLVGIDTPEDVKPGAPVECGAKLATASMDGLAPEGTRVLLRSDSVADEHDRYDRLLAHAYVGGRQLELAQLRRGWAEVYRYDGQRFDGLSRFEAAQDDARRSDLGVWSRCGGNFHSSS